MTIGHFGHFDPDYSRNRIIAKALRRAGATVITVTDHRRWPRRMPALLTRTARLDLDLLLVGFPGQADVAVAKLAAARSGVPVIADAFVSIYETAEDRARAAPTGLKGRRYMLEDRWSCRLADLVLLDTDSHIDYFVERFGVPTRKFRRVWLGADDEVMYPRSRQANDAFRVCFYGGFTPLQGIEHILDAAHLLERAGEGVTFVLVGDGALSAPMHRRASDLDLRSVRFVPRQPYDQLPGFIAGSDVWLGIFGTSGKAGRVIPNKAFDGLAMGRPLVTADTPAAREVLVHRTDAWLVPPGDPAALADAIRRLKADDRLRQSIAEEGHRLFQRRFSLAALASDLTEVVTETLSR